MSKKLIEILPSLQSFKDNVINQLTNMFVGAEWLNDATSYTKQETIYRLLILKYGDRFIRYDDEIIFLNRLVFDLADIMPDIYAKQQVFIKNKLNEYLSDNKNRAIIIEGNNFNSRNSDSDSKIGGSASPLDIVIDNASDIQGIPLTSSNLSSVKLVENYNGQNQQVNYNFVNDLVKTLNADYSLRLNEFMKLLGKHFVNVVGGFYKNQDCKNQTVKDKPYQFNNGYVVNEVDYLGNENQQEIKRFNDKLEKLSNDISIKQNQLSAGRNIIINNNVISAELSNYYNKDDINKQQTIQDNNINKLIKGVDTNVKNIELLTQQDITINNRIDKVIEGLNNATLINYKGQFKNNDNAKLGEVWSYDNQMWLCKVESTTTTPQEGVNWDLLSAPIIDLSDYYTKNEIDNKEQLQDKLINININDINNIKNKDVEQDKQIENNYNDLLNQIQTLKDTINKLQSIINEQQDYINQLKPRIGINIDSTNLIAPNGISQLSINNNNVYKKLSSTSWEIILSEPYLQSQLNNYYTKTDLSNYSTSFKLGRLVVGKSDSQNIEVYGYSNNEMIINFNTTNKDSIIGKNNRRITNIGDGWYFD